MDRLEVLEAKIVSARSPGVERAPELGLEREVLGDRLDDEVALGELVEPGREGEVGRGRHRGRPGRACPSRPACRATARSRPAPGPAGPARRRARRSGIPAVAAAWAMPLPICPQPRTPTRDDLGDRCHARCSSSGRRTRRISSASRPRSPGARRGAAAARGGPRRARADRARARGRAGSGRGRSDTGGPRRSRGRAPSGTGMSATGRSAPSTTRMPAPATPAPASAAPPPTNSVRAFRVSAVSVTWHQPLSSASTVAETVSARASIMAAAAPAERRGRPANGRRHSAQRLPGDPARLPPLHAEQLLLLHPLVQRRFDASDRARHRALGRDLRRARPGVPRRPMARGPPRRVRSSSSACWR